MIPPWPHFIVKPALQNMSKASSSNAHMAVTQIEPETNEQRLRHIMAITHTPRPHAAVIIYCHAQLAEAVRQLQRNIGAMKPWWVLSCSAYELPMTLTGVKWLMCLPETRSFQLKYARFFVSMMVSNNERRPYSCHYCWFNAARFLRRQARADVTQAGFIDISKIINYLQTIITAWCHATPMAWLMKPAWPRMSQECREATTILDEYD